jgi:nicotinamidase-related amidase
MAAKQKPQCALLVVDMQNAYFNNDALQAQRETLTEKMNELLALAKEHNIPIFNIRTEHQRDIATWTLNMLDDGQGYLFAGDKDSQNTHNLTLDGSIEVIKTRDSAFYGTTLTSMLANHNTHTLIVCGVSTHTCIFQTAADAYAANLTVVIASEATASHKPEYHQTALDILKVEYRQAAKTNRELQQYIQDNSQ